MACFLSYIISSSIINILLLKRLLSSYMLKKNKIETFLYILVFIFILTFINLFEIPWFNFVITLFCYLSMKYILFQIPISKDIVKNLIDLFIIVFLDSLSFFLSGFIYPSNVDYFRITTSSIMILLFYALFLNLFKYSKIEKVPKLESWLFLIISLFHVLLIYMFSLCYPFIAQSQKIVILFIILGIVCMNMIIFHYLEYIHKNHELSEKILQKKLEFKNMKQHYHDMKKQYQDTRKLIHDFKNHINAISIAYENNKIDVAKNLIGQFIEQCDKKTIEIITGSDTLDIILNDKLRKAEILGIDFKFKTDGVSLDCIKEFDLVTILGNLLDNAIEANESKDIVNKYIELIIYQKNAMIIIEVRNSCKNSLIENSYTYQSSKQGHSGLGIENVKESIQNYDGYFDIEIRNEVCTSIAYLLM